MQFDHDRITKLSKRLVDTIMANLTHVVRNGDTEHSYPGCVNLSFAYVEGESLLMALKGNLITSKRSCRNKNNTVSTVSNHLFILFFNLITILDDLERKNYPVLIVTYEFPFKILPSLVEVPAPQHH